MRQQTAEMNPAGEQSRNPPPSSPANAKARILRRLLAGFIVIIALLGLDGFVGFFGATTVRQSVDALSKQQALNLANIDSLRQAQSMLGAIEYRLRSQSHNASSKETDALVTQSEESLRKVFSRIPAGDPDIVIWGKIQNRSFAVIQQMRRATLSTSSNNQDFAGLLDAREALSVEIEKLIHSNHQRAEATRLQIEDTVWRQSIEDRVLLAACLLVSCLFLWTSTRIYYQMNQRSEELNHVSWQLLERQELLAQRLSRELHDELGQSLTALKTNFSRHAAAGCVDPSWMRDCNDLLKGSIRSAHEISQLLRPTLLDDFGLDSALSWLCERFEERNGIKVKYQSDYHWRLDEQAETHVFRIAQEALTNVARHAEASAVEVVFSKQFGVVRLRISDNGVGLKPPARGKLPSFGLIGIRARARSLEGEMQIQSTPGRGVAVEVTFPAKAVS